MTIEAYKIDALENLPDEIWKDVEDYEGYYQVSNYGRVKSLSRYVDHSRLGKQLIHPRILTQNPKKSTSKHFEDYYVDCQVALTKNSSTKCISVKRLVYSTFIEKIDFKEDFSCIVHKDFNGYNNHLDNLEKMSFSERFKKRIVPRERFVNTLKTADRSKWPKTYGGYSMRKPIRQITPDNNIIEYESIKAASRALKIDDSDIIKVLKGRRKAIQGHRFEYL